MKSSTSIFTKIVGIFLLILGLALAGGGAYLISLGGSWFYLPAGLAMAVCGVGFFRAKAWTFYLSLALLVCSLIWAFAEVGTDFWQLVPRTVAFLVVFILAALCSPVLTNEAGRPALPKMASVIVSLVAVISLVAIFANMFRVHPEVEADASAGPAKVIDQAAEDNSGDDWTAWGRNARCS